MFCARIVLGQELLIPSDECYTQSMTNEEQDLYTSQVVRKEVKRAFDMLLTAAQGNKRLTWSVLRRITRQIEAEMFPVPVLDPTPKIQ